MGSEGEESLSPSVYILVEERVASSFHVEVTVEAKLCVLAKTIILYLSMKCTFFGIKETLIGNNFLLLTS